MSKTSISTNQELHKGEYLMSTNGNFKAIFQEDGNFVIYKWSPVWATATNGKNPSRVVLQNDGNLVMYNEHVKPLWASNTCVPNKEFNKMRLTLTDEGRLNLENDGKIVWSSAK